MPRMFFPLLVILSGMSSYAADTTPAIENLTELLNEIQTLEADVTQLEVKSSSGNPQQSAIKMYFDKPDGFYWETLSPFEELVVTDGETLWIYDPELEQVTVEDLPVDETEITFQLLRGKVESLATEFNIGEDSSAGESNRKFTLTPKDPGSPYERVTLSFAYAMLEGIHVDYGTGEQLVWAFSDLVLNKHIPPSRFTFTVPEGIEVIENRASQ